MRVNLVEIKLRSGGKRVRLEHLLEVESLYIGRGPDNDLSLQGLTVSLHHATIRIGDGHTYIEAAAGSEITVNGLPTSGERLAIGNEIHIGPWTLRLIDPEPGKDLRIEYEKREPDDDARTALDRRTRLGIESGLFARRPLSWLAIGIILLGFLGLPLIWPALRPVWTTGPVIRGHALIENDCASCHGGLFQRVENQACTECHVDVRRHAPANLGMSQLEEMRCADCHLEHRGRGVSLVDQGAAFCVTCHADLSKHLPNTEFEDVSSFESQHPEFQLALVVDPADLAVRTTWSEELDEDSGVEFDHNFHVSQALDGPEDEEWLNCGNCHQVEEDGRAMQPVDFERHCRSCHEFDVGESELVGELEHGNPEQIRDQLRDFYTDQVLEARIKDRNAPPALRQRPAGRLVSGEERALSARWIGQKVAAADEMLFGDEACALCHDTTGGVVSEQTGEWVPRSVASVQVARSWIRNARFSHSAHATQACATCHPGAAVRDPDSEEEPDWARAGSIPYGLIDDGPGISASDTSANVMIPGIQTCRECHMSPGQGGHQKVTSACSACHDFHDHTLAPMARSPAAQADSGSYNWLR
jgi:hypothetical protein